MKKLISLSLIALFSLGCFAQKYDLPRKYEGLKGQIDSVEIKTFVSDVEGAESVTILVFDANGRVVKSQVKKQNETQLVNYTLDELGRPTLIVESTTASGTLKAHYETAYTYTDATNWEILRSDKLNNRIIYTDQTRAPAYGLTQYRKVISPVGDISNHHVGFDAKGNMLFDKVFNESDEWQKAMQVSYNANSQVTKKEWTALKTAKKIETYKYIASDDQGNWTKRSVSQKGHDDEMQEQTVYYRK